jgi:hypothetical protein
MGIGTDEGNASFRRSHYVYLLIERH